MSTTLTARGALMIDDELRAHARSLVEAVGDETVTAFSATTDTGRMVSIQGDVVSLLAQIVDRVAQGGEVSIVTLPEILTTSSAADALGISRTTLMKLISKGELRSTMTGTHHRLRYTDVLALKEKRDHDRNAAIEELLVLGEDEDI